MTEIEPAHRIAHLEAELAEVTAERDRLRDRLGTAEGIVYEQSYANGALRYEIAQLIEDWRGREQDPWYWSEPADEMEALL